MENQPDPAASPEEFWESQYQTKRTSASGDPSALLVRYAEGLPPGVALDLGCSHGDDAIWLASRGWRVVGVDISATAVERAALRAAEAGLGDRARFERRDLAEGLPEGPFDLVTAFYFQSPVELPRAEILRAALTAIAPGGRLLSVVHGSFPPWRTPSPDMRFPTPEEELDALGPLSEHWTVRVAEAVERTAKGPEGQEAAVTDTVLLLERR